MKNLLPFRFGALIVAAKVVEDYVNALEFASQLVNGRSVHRGEVHLNHETAICDGAPGVAHFNRIERTFPDGTCGLRSGIDAVDAERTDALGPLFIEDIDTVGRVGGVGVEEAGASEEIFRRFIREAVFEIRMVVLVRLGMDDYGMGDLDLLHKHGIVFQCDRLRLVSGLGVKGKFLCVGSEEMYVGIDEQSFELSGEGEGKRQKGASMHGAMICRTLISCTHHDAVAFNPKWRCGLGAGKASAASG